MTISISSIDTTSNTTAVTTWQQRQQELKHLASALQSGDINAANAAYASLDGSSNSQSNGPLAQVGQALQKGDLADAQQAFQLLSKGLGHHHHHAAPSPSTPQTVTSGTGTLINTSA